MGRDDFPAEVKEVLARRAGMRCSNPNCRQLTSGPQLNPTKVLNVGVAAHITAASRGGLRYDSRLGVGGRQSAENGIWLCQNCAKLVDNDPLRYTVAFFSNGKGCLRRRHGSRLTVQPPNPYPPCRTST